MGDEHDDERTLLAQALDIYRDGGFWTLARRAELYGEYRVRDWRRRAFGATPDPARTLRWYTRVGHRLVPWRYTDADPLKLAWIPPDDVTHTTVGSVRAFGRVHGGDWDLTDREFAALPRVRSLVDHFADGVPWGETAFYQESLSYIRERGYDRYGCTTEAEVDARFDRIDDLYERIASEGYKTQRELLAESPRRTRELTNDDPVPAMNEIGLNVGRDGDLLFACGGLHRLAIAKILGLDEVPVLFRVRHRQWQRRRNALRRGADGGEATRAHPDLGDLADAAPQL